MDQSKAQSINTKEQYRIGAVCRLTGLSPHVMRVWEKRYGVVRPGRSSGQRRLYSEADIKKLSLLKTLVDRGQAIGTLADLDIADLERRVEDSSQMVMSRCSGKKPRIVLLGKMFVRDAIDWEPKGFEIAGAFSTASSFIEASLNEPVDVAVLEWPSVHPDAGEEISRLLTLLNVSKIIVVYHYGTSTSLQKLNTSRIRTLKMPLELGTLEAVIGAEFNGAYDARRDGEIPATIPPRRFSADELDYISKQSVTINCECPRHLTELISNLCSFETYSAECEIRNEQDAQVHGYLMAISGQARSLLEQGLAKVIEVDELEIKPSG